MKITTSVPLSVTGARNLRDLGGYPATGAKMTQTHRYLRSDSLHGLTSQDQDFLIDYGVRCVIDLRTAMESSQASYQFNKQAAYYQFPLLDQVHSSQFQELFPSSMGELYVNLLDNSQQIFAKLFQVMAEYSQDCVLFHCTAGKDRTGVVSMLLLKLAGVEDEVVVEDYAATDLYTKESFLHQKKLLEAKGLIVPDYVGLAEPKSMQQALLHLKQKYGSAKQYLLQIGLSSAEIDRLCFNFV